MDENERALKIANKMIENDHFSNTLGIEIVSAEVKRSVCKMTIKKIHLNGHGTCHGGAIFSLADTTFAHLCNAHNKVAVAHMCHIAYWKPAIPDDQLFAIAKENGCYGRSGSYTITIHRGSMEGEVIAEFSGYSRSLHGETHLP